MIASVFDTHVPLMDATNPVTISGSNQTKSENGHIAYGGHSNLVGGLGESDVTGFIRRSCSQYLPFAVVLVRDWAIDHDKIETEIDAMISAVEACSQEGARAVVTAGVDLYNDEASDVIARLKVVDEIVGVRLLMDDQTDDKRQGAPASFFSGFPDERLWLENFALLEKANLLVDVDVYPEQIPQLYYLLRDFPDLKVVLGQSGFPREADTGGDETWRNAMALISSLDNVHVKLGGFHLCDPDWNCATIWPVVHHLLLCFGEERVMFGSNCDADWSEAEYASMIGNLAAILPSPDTAEKVFFTNGERLFGLKPVFKELGLEAQRRDHGPGTDL